MTDVVEQQDVKEVAQELDIKAILAENEKLKNDLKTVAEHKDKLYQETKKAKAEREAANAEAARIAEEKAKKDGEFESLWKTAKEREENLAKQLQEIRNANRQDKIDNAALKIAGNLAEGDNIELLSDFITRNLSQLADETGALSADVLKEVQESFANNPKYKSLMRGSKAVGGGAPGSLTNVSEKQDFSKLSPVDRINAARQVKK